MKRSMVVAVTGASGAAYSVRLLKVLIASGCDVHLTISSAAALVIKQELNVDVKLDKFKPSLLGLEESQWADDPKLQRIRSMAGIASEASSVLDVSTGEPGKVHYHHYRDFMAPIASGSFLTSGMVICPCSSGTLSGVVQSSNANLIQRAAEVHLKEQRKLVVVPRETPLSLIQIENMRRAAQAGVVVMPAAPGFYHGAETIEDLVDFIVARICDQLGVENGLIRRWGDS